MTSEVEELMFRSRRRRCLAVGPVVGLLLLATQAVAQRPGYVRFVDPERRFSIEYPRAWTWFYTPGSAEAIEAFVSPNREATFVVERFRLRQVIAPELVADAFAQIEADLLKENQPMAAEVVAKATTEGERRLIVIDYSRPDSGGPKRERVRQYSYPFERSLYRITCMASNGQFAKYEDTFMYMMKSLTPRPAAAATNTQPVELPAPTRPAPGKN
jgi:hypothetical protein